MPRATVGPVELEFETFGSGEPLVLVMGIGAQMVLWDEAFCRALASEGFAVTRFDNRDVGTSSQLDGLGTPSLGSVVARRITGRQVRAPYTLSDMADDLAGLLDALGAPSAHVVGISLGGMIAQCFALRHPSRLRSLALIMSSSGELPLLLPKPAALRALTAKVHPERDAAITRQIRLFQALGRPPHHTPEDRVRELAGIHFDRGVYPRGFARHFAAVMASEGRLAALRTIRAPSLVVHGMRDPLILPIAGRFLAAALPDPRVEFIEGMGHDMGPSVWTHIISAISETARRPVVDRSWTWSGALKRFMTPSRTIAT